MRNAGRVPIFRKRDVPETLSSKVTPSGKAPSPGTLPSPEVGGPTFMRAYQVASRGGMLHAVSPNRKASYLLGSRHRDYPNRGLRKFGKLTIAEPIATAEEVRLLFPCSYIEGQGFDGINTWHPQDCSFGNVQLNCLSGTYQDFLRAYKLKFRDSFEQHFLSRGLDVLPNSVGLSLVADGRKLERAQLRSDQFAAVVVEAAHDTRYQRAELDFTLAMEQRARAATLGRVQTFAGRTLVFSSFILSPNGAFLKALELSRSARSEVEFLSNWIAASKNLGQRLRIQDLLQICLDDFQDEMAKELLDLCYSGEPRLDRGASHLP